MNTFINIYAEITEEGIHSGVFELIDKAFEIKREQDKCINVFLIGQNVQAWADEIYQYGVDHVWFFEQRGIQKSMEDVYVDILTEWMIRMKPEAFLCCSTVHSKSIMPRIAVRLNTGLCADCLDINVSDEGKFVFTRTAHNGNLMADIIIPNTYPQMATIKANALIVERNTNVSKGSIHNFGECYSINSSSYDIKNEIRDCNSGSQTLEKAKIVVVAGLGIGNKENLSLIYDFISRIDGAELGATRAVVEKGWVAPSRQVGQTGVILNAEICILCGVSGAIQHKIGLTKCKTVIAINTDENAPIFQFANCGIVGDLFEVLPQMIDQIKDLMEI